MKCQSRLADHGPGVPDEDARHYDEPALAVLSISIGLIHVWNRLNVTTRQVAGSIPAARHWAARSPHPGPAMKPASRHRPPSTVYSPPF